MHALPCVALAPRYSGVVEMVRIRRSGFPFRAPYAEFAQRFAGLVYKDDWEKGLRGPGPDYRQDLAAAKARASPPAKKGACADNRTAMCHSERRGTERA